MTEQIKPQRIQRKRVKGFDMQAVSMALNGLEAVSVARPGKYGNPYVVGEVNRDTGEIVTLEKCLEYYEFYLKRKYQGDALREFLEPLKGKNLACFCSLDSKCHADVLLRLANSEVNYAS
jgi:hypothetical protein